MISFLRRLFVDSWAGRVFALLLFAAFVFWGIGGFVNQLGHGDAGTVASVGGQKVTVQDFDSAFRQQLAQVAAQSGGDPSSLPAAERGQIGLQVLQGLVSHAEALAEATRLGIVVPDDVLRSTVFDFAAFKGPDGRFDRARFDGWLSQHGLNEAYLLRLIREDMAASALTEPLSAAARAPDVLVRRAFDYEAQTRTVDMVRFDFDRMPQPAAPDQAGLQRWFDNHPGQFRSPEYRRVRVVVLSPETVARTTMVSEADERALYAQDPHFAPVPEKRSVQVITTPDQATADALAAAWKGGASWTAMQAQAVGKGQQTVPVALDSASQATFPDPALGSLAFRTPVGTVAGPVHLDTGWVLVKPVSVTPGVTHSFADERAALHDRIAAQRAADGMAERVRRLQDAIAGGGGLDQIPADIGAAAAEGTLDAQGDTQSGVPAPLPGSPALRRAIIEQAFDQKPGPVSALKQGPDGADYAVQVESVTPARPLTFAQAEDKVRAAFLQAAIRREANVAASGLYARIRHAGGLAKSGSPDVIHSAPFRRNAQTPDIPPDLVHLAFSLAVGESTMVETPQGFVVATVTGVQHPDPASDRLGYDRLRASLDSSVGDDIEASYAMALRGRVQPSLNAQAIRSVVGP